MGKSRGEGTPDIQEMYNRYRTDSLRDGRKYTLMQVKNTLETWLNKSRTDNRQLKQHVYPTDNQVRAMAKELNKDSILQGSIMKVAYPYTDKWGNNRLAIQYRDTITGQRRTRIEYNKQQLDYEEFY